MVISKGLLEERLKTLQNERAVALAQVSGYDGAIQDTEYWLQELEIKEDPKSDVIKAAPKPRLEEVKK